MEPKSMKIEIIEDDFNTFHVVLKTDKTTIVGPIFTGKISKCTKSLLNHSLKLVLDRELERRELCLQLEL